MCSLFKGEILQLSKLNNSNSNSFYSEFEGVIKIIGGYFNDITFLSS